MKEGISGILDEIFSFNGITERVNNVFYYADLANREIRRALQEVEDEELRQRINDTFQLAPSVFAFNLPEPLFIAHVRELIDWVKNGKPVNQYTTAEVLYFLSTASLHLSLRNSYITTIAYLYHKIKPYMPFELPQDPDVHLTNADVAIAEFTIKKVVREMRNMEKLERE